MRIVLFGKNGQLGWELHRNLLPLGEVVALDNDELDLANLSALESTLQDLKPDLIVNGSAYTAVDQAETEPEIAYTINGTAPGLMADAVRRSGGMLIHYSTDYVFDGTKGSLYTESDIPNPLNVYGKSKLAGEQAIQGSGALHLIFRTSWVYSLRGDSFVNKTLTWARKNATLNIVSDQIGNPTWARMLANVTTLLLAQAGADTAAYFDGRGGLYHLAGSGHASRFEWAREILAFDPDHPEQATRSLEPVTSDAFPAPAIRPLFSALDCSRFEETFGLHLPDWRDALRLAM